MDRWEMPAHIRIVELGLGSRAQKIAIQLRRHIAVTINGAADKFHFEGVKSFAVADGCQNVRMHWLAGNAGGNLRMVCRRSDPET